MAYCKIHLYSLLLESDLPEDPYLAHDLERYFPPPLPERYRRKMRSHRLRREIIATVVANQLVDRAGTTFVFRLEEETGAPASILARGYAVAREVFDMRSFWSAVEALDNEVEAETQLAMLIEARRLVERATRWLVRTNPRSIHIAVTSHYYEPGARMLLAALPDVLDGAEREAFDARAAELDRRGRAARAGAPSRGDAGAALGVRHRRGRGSTRHDPDAVMRTYFHLGSTLELNWLRDRIIELPRGEPLAGARARRAARRPLHPAPPADPGGARRRRAERGQRRGDRRVVAAQRRGDRARLGMLADIKSSRAYDTTTLPVALREVRNLIRGAAITGGSIASESVTTPG